MRFLIRWFANILALLVVIHTIAGVRVADWQTAVIAALVLGLLNAFLRPFLILLTLPLNIFSLGAFTLIINGFLFYLASIFVKGFIVVNFWSAFCAAALFSAISFIANVVLSPVTFTHRQAFQDRGEKKYTNVIDVEGKVEK